jgi:hypothetical protein
VPLPRASALSVLAGLVAVAVLAAPPPGDAGLPRTAAGIAPLTVADAMGCADLTPPLAGTGRVVPAPVAGPMRLPGDLEVQVAGGAVVAWRSPGPPVRAAIVAGPDRAHLYWYEPPGTADAGLRPPDAAAGEPAPVVGVELCRTGRAAPDLEAVCIRAGLLPLAGPSTYTDGAFDGALGPSVTAEVDPDDGTLSWATTGPPIAAVVTATTSPVLVAYDPPAASGTDVPFLGTDGTTGRVVLCGQGVLSSAPTSGASAAS